MSRRPWRIGRRHLGRAAAALTILGAAAWLWLACDDPKDIETGKLGLTRRWGWVNWGHAIPSAPQRLLHDLETARPDASGWITLTLRQGMSGNYGPLKVSAALVRTYQARTPKDQAQRLALGWALFCDVSEGFEAMQGAFPNALDPHSWRSSYRPGDLAGNRLAFFAARHGISLQAMHEAAGPVPPAQALALWNAKRTRSWHRPQTTGPTFLPDGRDPWDCAYETGAPEWRRSAENKIRLKITWR